ncbi:exported hypothetical protein [Mesorhizobium plurifarium]|uniref:Uncharacterized protein n=1 Tax=Mesorhizobium plurifarium TaxID=69974 RepID=A0A090EYD5_MESPL|nr:exported hypothetical protein [Mesorhizobium plurifarium]
MIGKRKERTERFFLAGASAAGAATGAAGWTGISGASVDGWALALGKVRTSAVAGALEDMGISLDVSQTEPFGSNW